MTIIKTDRFLVRKSKTENDSGNMQSVTGRIPMTAIYAMG